MAPGLKEDYKVAAPSASAKSVQTLPTSGHHAPQYDLLQPFSAFPESIKASTVWQAKDYAASEQWIHRFTSEEISDLGRAADLFYKKGLSLVDMSKENFRLGEALEHTLAAIREDLINGKGFILFKGFPTKEVIETSSVGSEVVTPWSIEKVAAAYMGLGSHIGQFVSQNGKGHVLGHVKDLGNDPTQIDRVRIYSTNARQFFHVDTCDIVGLLCLHRAQEGGESDIASSHHVYNILKKERPDVLETLSQPIWYFDRKGEIPAGAAPYFRASVFYYYKGRIILHWDPYYIRSLKRFWDSGELPPPTDKQVEAMEVLEQTAHREALHMVLEIGDVQFVSCNHVLHARTAYVDYPSPAPKRQLMRLWLATSESSGGWAIPVHDSDYPRRGGITIGGVHTSPLDAE